jgi:hypothetical protein
MINFSSGDWQQVQKWAEAKLATERNKNDDPQLDVAATGLARGRIAMLKELLALPTLNSALATQARMGDPDA